jgi:hypothetical protein
MARIYANENFPFPTVEELRRLGHDVLTTYESGRAGQKLPDEDMLAFAINQKRALLTQNRRHFIGLHEKKPSHCGIIVCTVDPDFFALAQHIHSAIQATRELDGQLIRINRSSTTGDGGEKSSAS